MEINAQHSNIICPRYVVWKIRTIYIFQIQVDQLLSPWQILNLNNNKVKYEKLILILGQWLPAPSRW